MSDEGKDLYVSSVEGHLVSRCGTKLLLGADRDPGDPSQIRWDTALVVKIPEAELAAYPREYGRAVRDGSLAKRTAAEFDAQCKALDDQAAKESKEREAAAKAAASSDADVKAEAAKVTKPKTGPARGAGGQE